MVRIVLTLYLCIWCILGCVSLLNGKNCVDASVVEEVDCITYTCTYDSTAGRATMLKDDKQRQSKLTKTPIYNAPSGNVETKVKSNQIVYFGT